MINKEEILVKRIRCCRAYYGYTQSAVAEKIYVSRSAYRSYENGEAQMPPEVLERLAVFYGVTTRWLTGTVKLGNEA
ncbi:MAG: helix-turn-helix transcriptional regulator [Clostridia bacterium]|nr:helix-turn-helix transcriptional regulator [Clostridia bacterium]